MTGHMVISGAHYREIAEIAMPLLAGLTKLDELTLQLPNLADNTAALRRGERLYAHLRQAQQPLQYQGKRLHRALLYSETYGVAADGTYALPLAQRVPRNEIGSAALELHILTNPRHVRGLRIGHHRAPLAKVIDHDLDHGLDRAQLAGGQRVALAKWRGLYMTQLTEVHDLADRLCQTGGVQTLWGDVRDFHHVMTGSKR